MLGSCVRCSGTKKWALSLLLSFSVPDNLILFQNHTLVTGGEDGKINIWPIHPVELEADELIDVDDADGGESMDIDMSSPRGRKRERAGDNELVCPLNALFYSILIDVIRLARQKSQTLNRISFRVQISIQYLLYF
jgi:hypothetical protein